MLLPTETTVSLRVVVDRSTVEAFAAGGRAVVSVRDFPREDETSARIRVESAVALTLENASGWSMGCGWLSEAQAAAHLRQERDDSARTPLAWRSPAEGAVCSSSASVELSTASDVSMTMTRQTCRLPQAQKLSPTSETQSDLGLKTAANLTLYLSPSVVVIMTNMSL